VKGQVGDLTGAQLRWAIDADGKPLRVDVSGKAPAVQSLSLFSFRAVGLPQGVTACPGTSWDARWERDGRDYSYQYRVQSIRDGLVRLEVRGRTTTPVNHWDVDGHVELAVADGFTGESALHVRGPGGPRLNDFDRRISIVMEAR
jgi:hypothetical protein